MLRKDNEIAIKKELKEEILKNLVEHSRLTISGLHANSLSRCREDLRRLTEVERLTEAQAQLIEQQITARLNKLRANFDGVAAAALESSVARLKELGEGKELAAIEQRLDQIESRRSSRRPSPTA